MIVSGFKAGENVFAPNNGPEILDLTTSMMLHVHKDRTDASTLVDVANHSVG